MSTSANYNESPIGSTTLYTRFPRLDFQNPKGYLPRVRIYKEDIVPTDPPFLRPAGDFEVVFDSASKFALKDPVTGAPIPELRLAGEVTHEQLYIILYSLALESAIVDDQSKIPPPPPAPLSDPPPNQPV